MTNTITRVAHEGEAKSLSQEWVIAGTGSFQCQTMSSPIAKLGSNEIGAAEHVIELAESGMTVGLGSGSTAAMWVHLLGERVRDKGLRIKGVASSMASERIG